MNIPSDKIRELTGVIRKSDTYRRYQRVRAELEQHTELKQQVDTFRRERYRMQQFGADMYAAADELQARYRQLAMEPLAVEYLELENSICRIIRETCSQIVQEIPLDLPSME
ncbi:MAG: YlbF family regulator [Eubacterium sp.]|nr:YlbF family regulator [Eubacterium sp.]